MSNAAFDKASWVQAIETHKRIVKTYKSHLEQDGLTTEDRDFLERGIKVHSAAAQRIEAQNWINWG
jgi:hypothetical protein